MHPNPLFRCKNGDFLDAMVDEIGFGMVFLTTPDGPRVAHTPLLLTGDGAVQFHLSRANALTPHVEGANALVTINGPDAYVSARWYLDPDQVPTWNYVALELEGPVREVDDAGLLTLLEALSARHESRISEGTPWTMDKLSDARKNALMKGILGFEMEVKARRETIKLSQNKRGEDHQRLIDGLEGQGNLEIAQLMRTIGA